jgi:hypothetical protein
MVATSHDEPLQLTALRRASALCERYRRTG